MTLVKSLYSVGLDLPSDWNNIAKGTNSSHVDLSGTLLGRSETIDCEKALKTIKSQTKAGTADTSSSSHCEDSGTCKTIDYTSIGKSTSPAKNMCCPWWNNSILAREEISSFSFWLWFWLLQDACLEFRNWASRIQHRPQLQFSAYSEQLHHYSTEKGSARYRAQAEDFPTLRHRSTSSLASQAAEENWMPATCQALW